MSKQICGNCWIYQLDPSLCRPELNCTDCVIAWLKALAGKHQEDEK